MALNTVKLAGDGTFDTAKAGGAITPGDLIKVDSNGDVVVHNSAGGNPGPKMVALENTPFNKTISDDYADNDQVQVFYPWSGAKLQMRLEAGSAPVTVGDLLESFGNGKLRKLASGTALFRADETKNANGGVDVLIKVTAI